MAIPTYGTGADMAKGGVGSAYMAKEGKPPHDQIGEKGRDFGPYDQPPNRRPLWPKKRLAIPYGRGGPLRPMGEGGGPLTASLRP
jgi:hypothetical protein